MPLATGEGLLFLKCAALLETLQNSDTEGLLCTVILDERDSAVHERILLGRDTSAALCSFFNQLLQ